MGLTYVKEEQLRTMPTIKTRIRKSQDGKLIINETTITDFKPVSYYRTVLEKEVEATL